jgi:hypothetical protein
MNRSTISSAWPGSPLPSLGQVEERGASRAANNRRNWPSAI